MGWLIHSMIPDIGENYLSMATTQDIWEAVAATYSRKGNFSQAFELRSAIERYVQGEQSVLQHFTFLSNGWKKLDHLQDYKPVCTTDSIDYKKFIEKERVFKFLEGLNVEFDSVCSRVLGSETLPSLQEVFGYVQNEESRRSAMMPAISSDRSTVFSASSSEQPQGNPYSSSGKPQLFCDYWHKPRHTRKTCWKLHGTPFRGCGDRSALVEDDLVRVDEVALTTRVFIRPALQILHLLHLQTFFQAFVGMIYSIGATASIFGVLIYHKMLKDYPFRNLLFFAQLLYGLTGMLDLVFIIRWNTILGIPDSFFVITEECVSRIVSRIRWIPMIVLSTRLCPMGIEGTFFALLMCIDSFGSLSSKWGGGMVLQLFHVTRTDFRNLWLVVLIRNILRIATLSLIFLVPNVDPSETLIPTDLLAATTKSDSDDGVENLQLIPFNEKSDV